MGVLGRVSSEEIFNRHKKLLTELKQNRPIRVLTSSEGAIIRLKANDDALC